MYLLSLERLMGMINKTYGAENVEWTSKVFEGNAGLRERVFADKEKRTPFRYIHNPSDNPKVLINAIENPKAVYGYSPNPELPSRIREFASKKYDWTDPKKVADYRERRIKYHKANDNISNLVISMEKDGATLEEIARAANKQRNQNRLNLYIKRNDFEGLAKVKASNLREYGSEEGLRFEDALKKYGSYEKIIESSMGANPGMDACCGLYDEYFHLYKID